MDVRLLVHLEPRSDGGGVHWWVESPDVHALSAAGDSLQEALAYSEQAAREILADSGTIDVSFSYRLVPELPPPPQAGVEGSAAPVVEQVEVLVA